MEFKQIKEFAEKILEECRQQGYKIHDFKTLQDLLQLEFDKRIRKLESELLWFFEVCRRLL